MGLGDRDKAIEELKAALSKRETDLTEINVEPYWAPLRSDPRFQDVVRRVGLSPD